jgi:xylan 1,4-beta-xylosidase
VAQEVHAEFRRGQPVPGIVGVRYGIEEVRQWYFEVWNKPNLPAFCAGTRGQYFGMYWNTAESLKEVDAGIRVGGPATAANAWIADFLDFCSATTGRPRQHAQLFQ